MRGKKNTKGIPKSKMKCNHCNERFSLFKRVDDKLYCGVCLKKICKDEIDLARGE